MDKTIVWDILAQVAKDFRHRFWNKSWIASAKNNTSGKAHAIFKSTLKHIINSTLCWCHGAGTQARASSHG